MSHSPLPITLLSLMAGLSCLLVKPAVSLPPPEDMPEEVLRTEIITEARSPLDGKPLTAAEYAQLQAELAQRSTPPQLDSNIRQNIFLLQLRRLFQTLTPL